MADKLKHKLSNSELKYYLAFAEGEERKWLLDNRSEELTETQVNAYSLLSESDEAMFKKLQLKHRTAFLASDAEGRLALHMFSKNSTFHSNFNLDAFIKEYPRFKQLSDNIKKVESKALEVKCEMYSKAGTMPISFLAAYFKDHPDMPISTAECNLYKGGPK